MKKISSLNSTFNSPIKLCLCFIQILSFNVSAAQRECSNDLKQKMHKVKLSSDNLRFEPHRPQRSYDIFWRSFPDDFDDYFQWKFSTSRRKVMKTKSIYPEIICRGVAWMCPFIPKSSESLATSFPLVIVSSIWTSSFWLPIWCVELKLLVISNCL